MEEARVFPPTLLSQVLAAVHNIKFLFNSVSLSFLLNISCRMCVCPPQSILCSPYNRLTLISPSFAPNKYKE